MNGKANLERERGVISEGNNLEIERESCSEQPEKKEGKKEGYRSRERESDGGSEAREPQSRRLHNRTLEIKAP